MTTPIDDTSARLLLALLETATRDVRSWLTTRHTASSRDGAVLAEVGPTGALTALTLDERAVRRLDARTLGERVVEAVHAAEAVERAAYEEWSAKCGGGGMAGAR